MTLEQLLEAVPDYAQDLRLNLSTLLRQSELSAQQLWGAAVASAVASRNPQGRRGHRVRSGEESHARGP
jgi:alkyl hydroperoxide reductase subunit D